MLTGAQRASAHRSRPTCGASAGRRWRGGPGRRGRRHRDSRVVAGGHASGRRCVASAAVGSDAVAQRHRASRCSRPSSPNLPPRCPCRFASRRPSSIPRNSFLRLRGLPPTASLSEGHSIAPGAWAIPLNGLPRLRLNLPASVSGKSELVISLVDEDGKLLAEARVSLVIQQQAPASAPPAPAAVEKERMPAPPPPRAQAPALTPAERENCRKAGRARRARSGAGQHRAGAAILPARRADRAGTGRAHAGGHL